MKVLYVYSTCDLSCIYIGPVLYSDYTKASVNLIFFYLLHTF